MFDMSDKEVLVISIIAGVMFYFGITFIEEMTVLRGLGGDR